MNTQTVTPVEPETLIPHLPMDKLAKIYIKIRMAEQDLTKDFEAKLAKLNEDKKTIANYIKDQMQASGVTSMRTEYGTVVLGKKTRYWTQDWDEFGKFCIQNNSIAFLEKRIAQGVMTQFLEENPGVVPPGLNSDTEYVVSVRKTK